MKNNKREKHSTFSYLKIIFTTDIRYLYILIIEIISSAFWALAPLGLTGYILTIYEKNQTKDGLLLIIMVCGIYTIFRLLISGVTIFVYNELVGKVTDEKIKEYINWVFCYLCDLRQKWIKYISLSEFGKIIYPLESIYRNLFNEV